MKSIDKKYNEHEMKMKTVEAKSNWEVNIKYNPTQQQHQIIESY